MNETHKYDDIIDLPPHKSSTRPRMSNADRAAQFSPFAALTGYDAAVKETERLTDEKLELTEDEKSAIDEKLQIIIENIEFAPTAAITYFVPDKRKTGGEYVTKIGEVSAVDPYKRAVVFTDKTEISVDGIRDITSPVFDGYYFGE